MKSLCAQVFCQAVENEFSCWQLSHHTQQVNAPVCQHDIAKMLTWEQCYNSSSSRWCYSPGWALASATICLQVSRFLALSLHSCIPIFLRFMDMSSSHLILGLLLRLVAYSFLYSIFFGIAVSCILSICPSHRILRHLINLTMFSPLIMASNSSFCRVTSEKKPIMENSTMLQLWENKWAQWCSIFNFLQITITVKELHVYCIIPNVNNNSQGERCPNCQEKLAELKKPPSITPYASLFWRYHSVIEVTTNLTCLKLFHNCLIPVVITFIRGHLKKLWIEVYVHLKC